MNEKRIKEMVVATLEKLEFRKKELQSSKEEFSLRKYDPEANPLYMYYADIDHLEKLIIRLTQQAIDLCVPLLESYDPLYVEYASKLIYSLEEVEA
jgi:hypothetical protein